ncbi:MAG: hypothetical protein IJV06_08155 [Bacteroidaceae bacterium]|nr:hypothetical protein [Bacteroidaceae bacterium]
MATTSEIKGKNLKFYISKTAAQAAALASTEPEAVCFTEAGIIMNGQVYAEPNVPQTNYAVTVSTPTAPTGVSKRYTIAQAATGLSVNIDIPKDMVVSSGKVETYTAGNLPTGVTTAGTYLVLTLANATSDKVYINVGSLIEYVTSGSGTDDAIQIAINSTTHKVTASVKSASITNAMLAGSIAASKLAGSIPKGKLDSGVQTSLGKADTALQSHQTVVLASGTNNGTLKITVNGVATDNIAVQGLGSAAYKTAGTASGNVPVLTHALEDETVLVSSAGGIKEWDGDLNTALSVMTERAISDENGNEIVATYVTAVATGDGNGQIKVTKNGTATNVSVKGLGSAAYKTAGTASGNVPTLGAASTSKTNFPVLFNSSGALIAGTKALGTAAYESKDIFADSSDMTFAMERISALESKVAALEAALTWQ